MQSWDEHTEQIGKSYRRTLEGQESLGWGQYKCQVRFLVQHFVFTAQMKIKCIIDSNS